MTTQQITNGPSVGGPINDFPRELFFRTENGQDVDAGPWALHLVRIGRTFAEVESDSPLTFALSLPILEFAGPLIAAGFIAERANRRLNGGTASAIYAPERAHLFRQLCALPTEMPVFLRLNSGKTVHAVFQGVREAYGEPWAVIRHQKKTKGSGKDLIREASVHRVIFVSGLNAEATEDAIGRIANVRLGLAAGFVADDFAVRELIFRSPPECALIGVVKTLTGELCDAKIGTRSGDGSATIGMLQDIVRVANLMRADEPVRSKLFTVKAEARETARWHPALAIFRGSSAYLNQGARFSAAHHVVLLSPAEGNFESAVLALNEEFLRKAGDFPNRGWTVPEGAVAMGFKRRSGAAP